MINGWINDWRVHDSVRGLSLRPFPALLSSCAQFSLVPLFHFVLWPSARSLVECSVDNLLLLHSAIAASSFDFPTSKRRIPRAVQSWFGFWRRAWERPPNLNIHLMATCTETVPIPIVAQFISKCCPSDLESYLAFTLEIWLHSFLSSTDLSFPIA